MVKVGWPHPGRYKLLVILTTIAAQSLIVNWVANEATFRVVMYDGGAVFELLCTGIANVVPPRKHGTRRTRRHRAFKDIFSFDGDVAGRSSGISE